MIDPPSGIREQNPFDVDVENCIREENIESAFLLLDLFKKTVEIAGIRDIAPHAGRIPANLLDGRGEFPFATTGDGSTALAAVAVTPTTGNGAPTQSYAYISSPISGNPSLTAIYDGDGNYQGSTSAPLVASPDFIVYNNAGIVFNTRGMSSLNRIILSPVDSFTGTVTFSFTGFPAESTCTLSPTSQDLTATTAFANASLTLQTTASRADSLPGVIGPQHWWVSSGVVMFAAMFLSASGRRRHRRRFAAFRTTVIMLLIGLSGCGGGGSSGVGGGGGRSDPGTPVGNYTITVTASSGKVTHSASFQLIVQ
jgi:hypothetical protein